jgi:hypothetical protein
MANMYQKKRLKFGLISAAPAPARHSRMADSYSVLSFRRKISSRSPSATCRKSKRWSVRIYPLTWGGLRCGQALRPGRNKLTLTGFFLDLGRHPLRQPVYCFCKRILLSGITANYPRVSLRKLGPTDSREPDLGSPRVRSTQFSQVPPSRFGSFQ